MIASVKQGESVSSERYKKKRKRQKKTDALVGIRAPSSLPFPAGYLLRGSFVNVRMLLPAPVVFALFVLLVWLQR